MAIYFFDKDQDLIKIVPDSATIEAYQKQELDDDSLLKDTLDVKVFGDEQLLDAEYMAVKSYEGNDQAFDMYRIVTDTTPDKTMSFTGMSLAPYELNGYIIQDLRPANHSLEYTLNRVLNGTDWRLGYIDDGLKNVTTNFYYVSVKEALKELQSLVGCEFVFKVEISGQKITDKWVEVYREMGNRTKKRFNYGTNALTVVRETNKSDIYTALIGRGKGEEVSSAEENESGQAGYGRKITFDEVEWSTAKGDPLDKPRGQYYLELPQATQAYGMRNVDGILSPRIGVVEFNDEEDPANLLRLTYEQLKVSARPKVLFKTTVANIGATGIGDTVTIHRHDLNMHYQTRVRKVVRNKLNDNKTQIELGDTVVTPSTKRAKQNNATIKNLKQELGRTRQEITETRLSADGKTNNHYGRAEPERKRTGDTWYRPHPSLAGEMQMLIWNGEAWELLVDTSDLEQVNRLIDEQEELLEKYAQDLKELTLRNDKELAEFDKQLEELRQSGVSEEQIDEAIKRAGFDKTEIENIRRQLGETSDTAELAVEMIGNDGKTRYSRNRVDGATDGQVDFGGQPLEVTHNGDGFVAGQTYTISFDALCEMLAKVGYTIDFNYPSEVAREVTVKLTPDVDVLDTIERTVTDSFEDELFEGQSYTVVISSDFYKTVTFKVQTTEDLIERLDLAFKEIVAGDLTSERILNWNDNPELVIKGVM